MNNNRNRFSLWQITNPYSSPSTVATASPSSTPTYTGYFNDNFANLSTFLVYVAENKTVYLSLGKIERILFISSSNPILSKASASSMTKQSRLCTVNPYVFSRWSSNLPGVATTIFIPFLSLSASIFLFTPPMISPCVLD